MTAGYPVPAAYFCWGANNAGTTSGTGAWEHVTGAGAQSGAFSNVIDGLTPANTYYYVSYATNAVGEAWGEVTNFLTFAVTAYTATNNGKWNTNTTWQPSTGYHDHPQSLAWPLQEVVKNPPVRNHHASHELGANVVTRWFAHSAPTPPSHVPCR